jgi:8-oxo-dGTP diphosphatase
MSENVSRKIARAIVIHDGRLLAIRRRRGDERFCTLPGGGIDPGETGFQAAIREVSEETSLDVSVVRLIYTETTERFGEQLYYLCRLIGDEAAQPVVRADSEEAADNAGGTNTYEACWLPLGSLETSGLRSQAVLDAILTDIAGGFPLQPKTLQH